MRALGNLLGTGKYRGSTMEEIQPMVYGLPCRHLVCDETYHIFLAFLAYLHDASEGIRHCYGLGSELGTHFLYKSIETAVLERMVYGTYSNIIPVEVECY